MQLELSLHNWRCFTNQKFLLPEKSLVIYDKNGNGKTSLISAIYSLYLKKPFPQTRLKDAITLGSNYFGVLTNYADFSLSGAIQNQRLKLKHNLPSKPIDFLNPKNSTVLPKILTYLPLDNYWLLQSRKTKLDILDTLLGQIFEKYDEIISNLEKYVKMKNRFILEINQGQTHFDEILFNQLNQNIFELSKKVWDFRKEFFDFLQIELEKLDTWLLKTLKISVNWELSDNIGNYKSFDQIDKDSVQWQKLWQKELLVGKVLFGATRDQFDLVYEESSITQILSKGEMRLVVLFLKKTALQLAKKNQEVPIWWFLDDVFNEFDLDRENLVWQELMQSADYYLATSSLQKNFDGVGLGELKVS